MITQLIRQRWQLSAVTSLRVGTILAGSMFLAACGGGGGGGSSDAAATPAATPPPTPAPTLTLTASSTSVAAGESVTLDWASTDADSCTASGGWSGSKAVSGSESVNPAQQSQTYSLSCSGDGGGTLREVTVTVSQSNGLSVTLTSDQAAVLLNGQVQLTWNSDNAESCEASGDWTGDQSLDGTFTTPALTTDSTFKLTCFAQAESAVSLVTVEVTDPVLRWEAPTQNVDGTNLTDLASFNVYWRTSTGSYQPSNSVNLGSTVLDWNINLGSGTYFLVVTAVDEEGDESANSNEVRKVIP